MKPVAVIHTIYLWSFRGELLLDNLCNCNFVVCFILKKKILSNACVVYENEGKAETGLWSIKYNDRATDVYYERNCIRERDILGEKNHKLV